MLRVLLVLVCALVPQIKSEGQLILTPLIKNGSIEEARNLSRINPNFFLGVESYSGFITVVPQYDSNLFFWYFPHEDLEKPWVIWLNGGPGISSLFGLFNMIGPVKVENKILQRRELTWTEDYSLLFIDSPVGAGFSYTMQTAGYTTNEEQVGSQLFEFLQQFLAVFQELRKPPLFIAGESYAGKYIPALAHYIHINKGFGIPINLKGLSMGNALIDMKYMLPYYNVLVKEIGVLADNQLEELKQIELQALYAINAGRMVDASNKFNETIEYIKKTSGVNIYNYLENSHSYGDFEQFVNNSQVRKEIHVGDTEYNMNNQLVYYYMLADISNSTKPFVEELLEDYGVMIFSGQLDMVVPYSLTKRLIAQLQWSKREQFLKAPRKRFLDNRDQSVAGYIKWGGNLLEALIRNSGHMVPKDKPEVIKYLFDCFVNHYKK